MADISTVPLDVFDDEFARPDEPVSVEATPTAGTEALQPVVHRWCQWCGVVDDPQAELCPTCHGKLDAEVPCKHRPLSGPLECQWCKALVPPDATECPG